jgi:hypothetical protein
MGRSSGWGDLWEHIGVVSEITRATSLGSIGWNHNTTYEITLDYTTTAVRVWVDGVLEFDVSGAFPEGNFGFYAYSQPSLRYTLVDPVDQTVCAARDTDGDGLTDPEELNTWGTDPSLADTDGDGLSDPDELFTHGTDPSLADTDGDDLGDESEVFDCPGCAWPDPATPGRLEFCEAAGGFPAVWAVGRKRDEGVKAAADEATYRRATPAFFAHHSVAELARTADCGSTARAASPTRCVLPPRRRPLRRHRLGRGLRPHRRRAQGHPARPRGVLHVGPHQQRGRLPLPALRPPLGTNNLPDCSNMCHESSGVALTRDPRRRQGHRHPRGPRSSPTPSSSSARTPAPTTRACSPRCRRPSATAPHRRYQPAARARTASVQAPAKSWRGLLGGHADRRPLPPGADQRRRRPAQGPDARPCWSSTDAEPGRPRPGLHREHQTASSPRGDDLDASSPGRAGRSQRHLPRPRSAPARWPPSRGPDLHCWAMGLTQHVNAVANDPGGRQPAAAARRHRQARRRRLPGARPQQRAGRPHHGHLGEAAPVLLDACAPASASSRRAHGYDTVHAIQAMHDGRVDVLFAMGGNFLSAAPDTNVSPPRRWPLPPHGPRLHQAQPLPPPPRRHRAHPALPRPHRARPAASGPQFVTVEDSMGVVHRSQGRLPRPPPTCAPSRHRLRPGPRGLRPHARRLAPPGRRLRPHPRPHRPHPAGLLRLQRPRPPPRRLRPAPPGPRQPHLPHLRRPRAVHRPPPPAARPPPGELLMMTIRSHDQYNTTVYTNWTTATAACTANAASSSSPPPSSPAWASPAATPSASSAASAASSAPPTASPSYRTTSPPAPAPPTSPRPTASSRWSSSRTGATRPASKSVVITVRPQR